MIEKQIQLIDKSLAAFMEEIKKDYKLHLINPTLYESIREFCLRKGKRIRPLLFILSYKGYSPKEKQMPPSLYKSSTCIELLHNFMLIHDDIIDLSNLRRGKPTMHKILEKIVKTPNKQKLGFDLGIIAGDIVYAFAIDAFLSIEEDPQRKARALKYFVQTAAFTAMGEFLDTINGIKGLSEVKEKDVFLNYSLKTARYTFDCPLVIGAILAGAEENDIKKLSKIGLLIGQAFQIQDDIIGIFDTQKNIGKSILSDIAESKKTILVCHAYAHLKGKDKKQFISCFSKPKKTYNDLVTIRKIFIHSESLQYSVKQLEDRLIESFKIIEELKMKETYKEAITQLINNLFKHSKEICQKNGR